MSDNPIHPVLGISKGTWLAWSPEAKAIRLAARAEYEAKRRAEEAKDDVVRVDRPGTFRIAAREEYEDKPRAEGDVYVVRVDRPSQRHLRPALSGRARSKASGRTFAMLRSAGIVAEAHAELL